MINDTFYIYSMEMVVLFNPQLELLLKLDDKMNRHLVSDLRPGIVHNILLLPQSQIETVDKFQSSFLDWYHLHELELFIRFYSDHLLSCYKNFILIWVFFNLSHHFWGLLCNLKWFFFAGDKGVDLADDLIRHGLLNKVNWRANYHIFLLKQLKM